MPAGVSAWKPLANLTVTGSSTNTVTFSSIDGSYRDLVLVINGTNSVDANLYLRINSDTANYAGVLMFGNGSSVGSFTDAPTGIFFNNYARIGTAASQFVLNFMDYSATDKHKTVLASADKSSAATERYCYKWGSTSAITNIVCTVTTGNLVAGSTFALYGVSA